MKKIIIAIVCLLGINSAFAQMIDKSGALKKEKPDKDWYIRSVSNSSVYGVGAQTAVNRFAQMKPSDKKLIVAVIDSGLDTDHDCLKNFYWTNEDEIPGNGIDDDHNGYIDDVHGWCFIPDGKDGKGMIVPSERNVQFFHLLNIKKQHPLSKEEQALWEHLKWITPLPTIYEDYLLTKSLHELLKRIADDLGKEVKKLEFINNRRLRQYLLGHYSKLSEQERDFIRIIDGVLTKENKFPAIIESVANKLAEREKLVKRFENKVKINGRLRVGDDIHSLKDCHYGEAKVSGEYAVHGTHVAGTITKLLNVVNEKMNNRLPVEIMAVKAVPMGDENDKDIALAIRYAVDNGAKIINMSFGKTTFTHPEFVKKALDYAARKDVLIIHAAGNDNRDLEKIMYYPTPFKSKRKLRENMITVGASDMDGNPASFSNYSKGLVDLFAPGVNIYSTVPGNKFKYMSGTSMASPVVTGVAALLRIFYPSLSAEEIKDAMVKSDKISPLQLKMPLNKQKLGNKYTDIARTNGIIDLDKCLDWLEENYRTL